MLTAFGLLIFTASLHPRSAFTEEDCDNELDNCLTIIDKVGSSMEQLSLGITSLSVFSDDEVFDDWCRSMVEPANCLKQAAAVGCSFHNINDDAFNHVPELLCNKSVSVFKEHATCLRHQYFEVAFNSCVSLYKSGDNSDNTTQSQCRRAEKVWQCLNDLTCDVAPLNRLLADRYHLVMRSILNADSSVCNLGNSSKPAARCRLICSEGRDVELVTAALTSTAAVACSTTTPVSAALCAMSVVFMSTSVLTLDHC